MIKKIRAGALQFVLFVGAIIAVLLMCFVLVSYTQVLFKKKTAVTIDMVMAAQEGLERSFTKPLAAGETFNLSIQRETKMEVTVEKKHWGLLELRTAEASKAQLKFSKIGFVGRSILDRPVLYLKDNQRPVVIAGKARIRGNAKLPQRGIKRGNIRGQGYSGSQMVYGNQSNSNSTLPQLYPEMQSQLERYTQPFFEPEGEQIRLQKGLVLGHSFKEPTKVIMGDFLKLEQLSLTGNIMVWATRKIVVHPSAQLKDVILVAPKIEVKDRVQGNFQAISREEITIGKECALSYPTVLAVQQPKNLGTEQMNNRNPNIILGNRSVVRGMILYQTQNEPDKTKANIHIASNAVVMGELFCGGNLEVKGTVLGATMTHAFIAMENGSAYQNHLFNGVLDSEGLPQEYAGWAYQGEAPNSIVKWLY